MSEAKTARNDAIVAAYLGGASALEIGRRFGLSGQRVGAILKSRVSKRPPRTDREKVLDRISKEDRGFGTPCWLWTGDRTSTGYGRLHKDRQAHRVSYEAFVGPISPGLHVDHLCRTPLCVNPDHLEPVTCGENIRRGKLADLRFRRDPISHCPYGHEYTPENSYFDKRGTRSCRECRRLRSSGKNPAASNGGGQGGVA